MCRNNEHLFCLDCITEHLRVNSQTCPECNEHLSVDTLRRARLANNYLSKLKINCDHASRGCPEFICLEELKTHVATCGYTPVLCSNAECGMEINKQDKIRHETEVCEYRRVKCHDCGQIQEDVQKMKRSLLELDAKGEETNKELKSKLFEVKQVVGKLEGHLIEKVEALRTSQDQIKQEQQEVKKEVKDVKESVSKVNKDVDEVKVMMIQMLEKLNMLKQHNKVPSPAAGILDTPKGDILVAGGYYIKNAAKSTEIYSWEKNGWFKVSEMNEDHWGASSFIYNNQLFVVGGFYRKTIETLDLNELPLKWMKYDGELPQCCSDHQTVVYEQRIIHIGGYNRDQQSDMISELQLTSPCTMKKLCQMPEPRDYHGAEIFEDKVMILGGQANQVYLNTVLEFDVNKNECKEMSPLPRSLSSIATVCWRNQVVVLGGCNKRRGAVNDVFMYDCKTGKTTALPSMLEKRSRCCAVITGDTIVVMGGDNEKGKTLSSVECFTMGGSAWEYLPAMNESRTGAVAKVLPSTRKYV